MPHNSRHLVLVFAAALLLSAGLLFNLQPMVGKLLLPRGGGSPQAWNITLAFFQLALLTGYLLAHLLSRLTPRQHGLAYLVFLLLGCSFLPITLPPDWHAETGTIGVSLRILLLLCSVVAVPFIALSLSAPTLQRLFASSGHVQSGDPYFLYVASNLGSFTGLLLYPFVFEPLWSLSTQTRFWQYGFIALIALAGLCLLLQHKAAPQIQGQAADESPAPSPGWKLRGQWALLAFVPSSLTLGVTTFITSDVTSAPLLWVVTLAIYLLTFMLAFSARAAGVTRWATKVHLWLATAAIVNTMLSVILPWPVVVLHLLAFFATALACHGRLAALRPDARHLTEFYLWLSIGGALGGSFNAFVAPLLFNFMFEYALVLILAVALHLRNADAIGQPQKLMAPLVWILLLGSLSALNSYLAGQSEDDLRNILLVPLLATLIILIRPYPALIRAAALVMLVFLLGQPFYYKPVFAGRSFFGSIIVSEFKNEEGTFKYRLLQHGTTTHGVQFLMPGRETEPTAYYANGTSLNMIWTATRPRTVAVMGLGSGTLNCLAAPGQNVHFYEIDPLMVKVAREQFSFLSKCPRPEISIGDGRLMLAQDQNRYDLIIIDVFSSDAIPTHIITREAIAMYMSKLTPDGVLGFHISNRFFDLEPVLAAAASDLGLTALYGLTQDREISSRRVVFETQTVAMARSAGPLRPLLQRQYAWRPAQNPRRAAAWTDDYFNIFAAIK